MSGKKLRKLIFEDTQCMVIEQNPIHFLVLPKNIPSDKDEKLLGHLLIVAGKIAVEKGLQNTGYHITVDEDIRSSKFKCLHVIGRPLQNMWPSAPWSRL